MPRIVEHRRDYVFTLASGVAVSFYSFVILKLVLVMYGEQALEFFAVLKRYQAVLLPLMLLGFGVTLPKYLAMGQLSKEMLAACLALVGGAFCVTLLVFWAFWGEYWLAVPLSLPALAAGFLYSVARGQSKFLLGGGINIVFLVFIPSLLFLFFSDLASYIVSSSIFAVLAFLITVLLYRRALPKPNSDLSVSKLSFFYTSFCRVPGDFLNQAILFLPVQYYLFLGDTASAAHLSVALSFALAAAIPLKPVSTILLVKVSMVAPDVKANRKAMLYCCLIGLAFASIYRALTWVVNRVYFDSSDFLHVLNVLAPVVLFYSIYVLVRSYVDALFSGPVLTYVNLVSLLIGGAFCLLLSAEPWAFVCVSYGCAAFLVVALVLVKKNA